MMISTNFTLNSVLNGSSSTSLNINEEPKAKKKKRRVRKAKKKNDVKADCWFSGNKNGIKTTGIYFRTRNTRCDQINLGKFLSTKMPYVFNSSITREHMLQRTFDLHQLFKSKCFISDQTSIVDVPSTSNCVPKYQILKNPDRSSSKSSEGSPAKAKKRDSKSVKTQHPNVTNGVKVKETATDTRKKSYDPYITEEEVITGLEKGTFFTGNIRINGKNVQEAYVTSPDGLVDYHVHGLIDRNRALEGDEVIYALNEFKEGTDLRQTARVVFINKMVHSRTSVGNLRLAKSRKKKPEVIFVPRDNKFPHVKIPLISCPPGLQANSAQYADQLFLVKLVAWSENTIAEGVILEILGQAGDLKVETEAILKIHHLDVSPFPVELTRFCSLKEKLATSMHSREDLRNECIFTIDPLTARDLDDSVSCKELDNGNFEIGVHIADVASFLQENGKLDRLVSKKATTIYLVDNVYHMLPYELCMQCSLLPGEDKLAFSVIWEMTKDAEIVSTRFSKTVVNSCCQLAYEHAQAMIVNPNRDFTVNDLPQIFNGYNARDLTKIVNNLQSLAVKMRNKRIEDGALRIDQVKLSFALDPITRKPTTFFVYEQTDAHRLIEEFMLLANISAAELILKRFPDIAFLRFHNPPKLTMMKDLKLLLETLGLHIDISCSRNIQNCLSKYKTQDLAGNARMSVLNHLLAKPMQRAEYFCTGLYTNPDDWRHYALNIPLYTHFTSPIRRYADIMVHRLLAAAIDFAPRPKWCTEYVTSVAEICNRKKVEAKRAGDDSSNLYLAHYIESKPPFIREAAVIEIRAKFMDVIILETGTVLRLKFDRFSPEIKYEVEEEELVDPEGQQHERLKFRRLKLKYEKTATHNECFAILEVFSIVRVRISKVPKSTDLRANLLRPLRS